MHIHPWLISAVAAFVMAPLPAIAETLVTVDSPQVGMPVFSIDGQKIGTVESVNTPDGRLLVVYVSAGSVLGFGTKLVAIPRSRFTLKDRHLRVEMTADDVATLWPLISEREIGHQHLQGRTLRS
jgi:hypothetical protein